MPSHYTKEERESHVKAWKKSKLSQEAYCKIKGLTWTTFKNWCKPTRRVKQNYPLVPIQVTAPQDGKRASLTLQSPQGWMQEGSTIEFGCRRGQDCCKMNNNAGGVRIVVK